MTLRQLAVFFGALAVLAGAVWLVFDKPALEPVAFILGAAAAFLEAAGTARVSRVFGIVLVVVGLGLLAWGVVRVLLPDRSPELSSRPQAETPETTSADVPTPTPTSSSAIASTIPPALTITVVDRFEYMDNESARSIWKTWISRGHTTITTHADIHAPESTRSMHIYSYIPSGEGRYCHAYNIFDTGTQDWSAYSRLHFWARTAPHSASRPYGGELSIELIETDPDSGEDEIWRNTRWFGNSNGEWISITLVAGTDVVADPWDPRYRDKFVVPREDNFSDGVLDLTHIAGIRINALTSSGDPQEYQEFDLWIDEMMLIE